MKNIARPLRPTVIALLLFVSLVTASSLTTTLQVAGSTSVVPQIDWFINPLLSTLWDQAGAGPFFGGMMGTSLYAMVWESTPSTLDNTFPAISIYNVSNPAGPLATCVVYAQAGHGVLNGWASNNISVPVLAVSTVQQNTSVACGTAPIFCTTYYTIDFYVVNPVTGCTTTTPKLSINMNALSSNIFTGTGTFTGMVGVFQNADSSLNVFYQFVNKDVLGVTLGVMTVNSALTSYQILTTVQMPKSVIPYQNFLANNGVVVKPRGHPNGHIFDLMMPVNLVNISLCPFGCGSSNVSIYTFDANAVTITLTGSQPLNGYGFFGSFSPKSDFVAVGTSQSSPTFEDSNTYQVQPPYPNGAPDVLNSARYYSFDPTQQNYLSYAGGFNLNSYVFDIQFSPSEKYIAVVSTAALDVSLSAVVVSDYYGRTTVGKAAPCLVQVFVFGTNTLIGQFQTGGAAFGLTWIDDQTLVSGSLPTLAFPEVVVAQIVTA